MKNRITADLLAFAPDDSRAKPDRNGWLHAAQSQMSQRGRWVKMYIQDYPAVGIGAALCIGVVIGWINKRR